MENLLVSVSGGESSMRMAQWLKENKTDEYNMLFAFANTSREEEETLIFLDKCDKNFDLSIVYIEGVFSMVAGVGTSYKTTDFKTARRNGEVFKEMIKSFGIPNRDFSHCTRELKTVPLKKLANDIFGTNNYHIAIGYRSDEIDRCNPNWRKIKHYYPLVELNLTKPHINSFWNKMPFRLNLKGYQGNCKDCWKKSLRKVLTKRKEYRESGKADNWCNEMEDKYGNYIPPHRAEDRQPLSENITFFIYEGKKISSKEIDELSKKPFKPAIDDSVDYNLQDQLFGYSLDISSGCIESCEPF